MSKLRKRNLVRLEQALQRLGTELVHRRFDGCPIRRDRKRDELAKCRRIVGRIA
jgi:hypothetical protein